MVTTNVIAVGKGERVETERFDGVGEFIRARRRLLGNMSQERLGELIGRDQTFVSQMERNATDGYLPERDMLRRLAVALECHQSDLIRAAGYLDDEPEWITEGSLRQREYELRRALVGMRDQLTAMIGTIDDYQSRDTVVTRG